MTGSSRVATALVVVGLVLLVLPAAAGALPPEYSAMWAVDPGGMRSLGTLTTDAGMCRGPSGYVFEVASQSASGAVGAAISKVAIADGDVVASWTYPADLTGADCQPRVIGRDPSGNIVVAMESSVGWTVAKFSSAGALLWDEDYAVGDGAVPAAMCFDRTGAVIVAGRVLTSAGGFDGAVVKWSSAGGFKWAKSLTGTGTANDVFASVGTDAKNNVYACGMQGGASFGRAVVRSYTAGGGKRWYAAAGQTTRSTRFVALVVKGTSVYLAGDCTGAAGGGFIAAKYTLAGKRQWGGLKTRIYAEGGWASGMAVDRTNAVIVAGEASELPPGGVDVPALWKVSPLGKPAWHREVTGTGWSNGGFAGVALDSKNRIYAAGFSGDRQPASGPLLMRYSAIGTSQAMWTPDGNPGSRGEFLRVLVVTDAQVLVAGILETGQRSAVVYRAKTTR